MLFSDSLQQVADAQSRRRLRSSSSSSLIAPVTLGDRAFPVVAARAWNGLPDRHVISAYLFRVVPYFDEDVSVLLDFVTLTTCVTLTLNAVMKRYVLAPC